MTVHYTFGGSTAARTINCPAWVSRSAHLPKKGSSSYAVEGSMLHEVSEKCLLEDKKPEDILKEGFTYTEHGVPDREFTEDDLPLAEIAYDAIHKLMEEHDIEEYDIEPFVEIVPDMIGGSIDFIGVSKDRKTVLVADYKFGAKEVKAENNKQTLFYADAVRTDAKTKDLFEDAETVVVAIIQPRVKGVTSEWAVSMDQLDEFHDEYMAAVEEAQSDNPTAQTGDHCLWCPFAAYCPEKQEEAVGALTLNKSDAKQLEKALTLTDQVESWAKEVKAEAHRQLEKGGKVKGWKLVGKRAVNAWVNQEKAEKLLKIHFPMTDLYTQKFITAPQALMLVKKYNKKADKPVELDDLIDKVAPNGTTLVPADDPREEVKFSTSENLKNLFK